MKLDFAKRGKQFFFVTMTAAGRRPIFSQIDADGGVRLSPAGEVVKAAFLAVHRVWPALTLSNYVVMPDHIHYLLIANFDCHPAPPTPLFVAHRLADAVEMALALEGTGAAAPAPPMDELLREATASAKANYIAQQSRGGGRGFGGGVPVRSVVFARDCYIELSFDSRQLKAIRHYIKLNPARALWKARHPDRFRCHRAIKAARLAQFAPTRFDAVGDLTILGSPFLFHVRLTLKKTIAEHAAAIDDIVEKARHGMVPVSGFISPGEREALRRLKAEPLARFIKLLPNALPDRYDPSSEDSRELAAGRMAILSAFPETPAISASDMRQNAAAAHVFRQNCLALNDFAAALCAPSPAPLHLLAKKW